MTEEPDPITDEGLEKYRRQGLSSAEWKQKDMIGIAWWVMLAAIPIGIVAGIVMGALFKSKSPSFLVGCALLPYSIFLIASVIIKIVADRRYNKEVTSLNEKVASILSNIPQRPLLKD